MVSSESWTMLAALASSSDARVTVNAKLWCISAWATALLTPLSERVCLPRSETVHPTTLSDVQCTRRTSESPKWTSGRPMLSTRSSFHWWSSWEWGGEKGVKSPLLSSCIGRGGGVEEGEEIKGSVNSVRGVRWNDYYILPASFESQICAVAAVYKALFYTNVSLTFKLQEQFNGHTYSSTHPYCKVSETKCWSLFGCLAGVK